MNNSTNCRVLVVADNRDIHADFRKILATDDTMAAAVDKAEIAVFGNQAPANQPIRFEVESADRGAGGLARVTEARATGRPYTLVFVDVRTSPNWDGIGVIEQLWRGDPDAQVVICTAFPDHTPETIAKRLGATDRLFILKMPFDNIEVHLLATSLAAKCSLRQQLESRINHLETLVKDRTGELERSNSLIKVTLDSTTDGILVVDPSGRALNFNDALLGMWNVSSSRLEACDTDQTLAPILRQLKNPEQLLEKIRESLNQAELDQSGLLEFKDGRLFEYHSRSQRMGTVVIGRVWSFRDITHRKRAEEALRKSENHYRLLFENNPTPVYVYDQKTLGFLAANEAAVFHYGYSRDEFLSLTLKDIALPEDIPTFLERLSRSAFGAGNSGIWRHRKKGGKLSEMELTSHSLVLGERKAWLSLAMDVTERLSLEAQLRQSQKMESVGQLAGGIAHDFNNLLTVINGHSGILLAMKNLSPQIIEPVREISEASRRAADLTRQLLTFSRKQVIDLQVVDLNEVVKNVSKLLRRILGEDISLEVNYSPGLTSIKADLGMIEQILLNLAVNSRDAMPKGGNLRITTSSVMINEMQAQQNPEASTGRFVCLTIADTGCGITPENLPRIFEPFFTTKEMDRGTGLGLATVYGIVKQHQGWIQVDSQLREGTTFQILLPACNEKSGPLTMASGEQRAIGGTETILVVEDELPLLKLIHHILESHGYKVLECTTGNAALKYWEEHLRKIDLLLTDMVLPDGMTGPELAQILQASKPGLKVIYTSGYDTQKLAKDLALNDGSNFIQKPFHARKLAETVYDCLNGK